MTIFEEKPTRIISDVTPGTVVKLAGEYYLCAEEQTTGLVGHDSDRSRLAVHLHTGKIVFFDAYHSVEIFDHAELRLR